MKTRPGSEYQHPFLIRLTHWVNFVALLVMVASGLRIYNASPLFPFRMPASLTLGGWLAGARQWHFAAMYLFAANGIFYVVYNLVTRHGRRTTLFRRSDAPGILPMVAYYLRLRKDHPPQGKYNPLQKLAYTTIPLVALGALLTGVAIYWPVQFQALTRLMGGYDVARILHFVCMAGLVLFFAGHMFMVLISGWNNGVSIVTGWKRTAARTTAARPRS